MPRCNDCGGNVDLAKDSNMGHCADCNNIVEVKEESKSEPSGSAKEAEGQPKAQDEEAKK